MTTNNRETSQHIPLDHTPKRFVKPQTPKYNQTLLLTDEDIADIFVPHKNMAQNEENFYNFLTEIVQHIYKIVQKAKIENTDIQNNIGKSSAREILSHGKIFFLNPCLDLSLATIEWLKKSWVDNTFLVINELECPWNIYKIHFGVEIVYQQQNYYIDYKNKNNVHIGKGKFESDYKYKQEYTVNAIHIHSSNITTDDNIYDIIQKQSITLQNFDLTSLQLLQQKRVKHNNEKQRNRFRNEVDDVQKPKIYRQK